jgi:hypothetical protein
MTEARTAHPAVLPSYDEAMAVARDLLPPRAGVNA